MEFHWNLNLAKEMIAAAKESGADFAKFQTWSTKDLVKGPGIKIKELIYKKAELSIDDHHELKEYCDKKNYISNISF